MNGYDVRERRLRELYDRLLVGTEATGRYIAVRGRKVHIVETGNGPPLVLLHGTGSPALFFRPLFEYLESVRAIAPDRPGHGLSDPTDLPRQRYRQAAIDWVDGFLDALNLDSASLLGHSMGGLWSLWYALAHPERVERLVLIGPPQLPGTRAPLPFRVMATPVLGELFQRFSPATPESVLQFARLVNEEETLPEYPGLIELLVAVGRDAMSVRANRAEARVIVSPLAIVSRTGFRSRLRVRPEELRQLTVPTLLVWGEHDPTGEVSVAKAVTGQIPQSKLEVLAAGHAPWLAYPGRVAELAVAFARGRLAQGG